MLTGLDLARFVIGAPDAVAHELPSWPDLLSEMLVVSTGRPWRERTPGLTGAEPSPGDDIVRVSGLVGPVRVVVVARLDERGLALELTWSNDTGDLIADVVVGLRVPGPGTARVTMPQVIYHDNPSADPDRVVPHVGRGGFVTEVHRLPVPAVCLQDAQGATLTLVSLPDPDEDASGRVRYGSLGAVASDTVDGTRALGLSGVTLFDGEPDVTYVHKARTAATADGYRDLPPGGSVRQRFLLARGRAAPGQGFRELVRLGRDLFDGGEREFAGPLDDRRHLDLRVAALDARAFTDGPVTGYLKFPAWGEPRARPGRAAVDFLYGWTGQCLRLAWCDAWVGLENSEPDRVARARAASEFYLGGSGTSVPGLRYNSYVHDDRRWQGLRRRGRELVSARAHGETICDLADLITLLRDRQVPVPPAWSTALQEAAEFITTATAPSGLVPIGWTADGHPVTDPAWSAGIPAVRAVARAAEVCARPDLLGRAITLADGYHELHAATFDRPFAHSTLDAACEDKEGGMSYFELLMTLYDQTGDGTYLERARVVAEWLLTWVYHWNPRFDRGAPLREAGFNAIGWPGVSVQNHHLDVFFPSFDLWRLGRLTGDAWLQRWARTIMATMGQGVCTTPGEWGFDVVGEQAEAFFVTNWQDRGHSNTWNPSWVIALPLWQLLRFTAAGAEVGVDHVAHDVRPGEPSERAVPQA
ncbi:hypothetical protein EXU48_22575 [Occultella glacieicola]|uniref:Uncharacterized protein n=1 Tax=Occultella glacieicola TaxID=2518684 RepID=A0ABY2DX18_9MICO|nr:hypothetical protein [Occultella glacieicola]TDE88521.1 hypothetical protein EXU48_22575 [Occultella glacieicola]